LNVQKRQALLVLGMHRSGTSALTGLLGEAGAALPKTQLPANKDNPKGYGESKVFMTFNEDVLGRIGSSWDDLSVIEERTWKQYVLNQKTIDELSQHIRSEFDDADLIAIKDPRICRLAPLWIQVLEKLDYKVLPALIVRNPLETARSLNAREQMHTGAGLLLWLRSVLDAEAVTRSMPRAVVSYESLLESEAAVLEKISGLLAQGGGEEGGERLHYDAGEEAFIDPGLRHQAVSETELASSGAAADWLVDTYKAMLTLCDEPDANARRAAYRALNRVKKEFDLACRQFWPFLLHRTRHHAGVAREARKLGRNLQSVEKKLLEKDALASKRAGELVALERRLEHKLEEMEALKTKAASYQKESERQQAELTQKAKAITERDEAIGKKDKAIAEGEATIKRQEADLENRRKQVESLTGELQALREQGEKDAEALEQARSRMMSLQGKLGARVRQLEKAKTDISALEARLQQHEQTEVRLLADLREAQQWVGVLSEADEEKDKLLAEHVQSVKALRSQLDRANSRISDLQKTTSLLSRRNARTVAALQATGYHAMREVLHVRLNARRIRRSGLFDAEHYLAQLERDKVECEEDALQHYLKFGDYMGYSPHALFDVNWYLSKSEDVEQSGAGALLHFVANGADEGRQPHPLFDPMTFERSLPGDGPKEREKLNALTRYLQHGPEELTDPHPYFSTSFYLQNNPDVARAGLNPLLHYMQHGSREMRSPHPDFDEKWYREKYGAAIPAGMSALEYHVREGALRGYEPNPSIKRQIVRTPEMEAELKTVLVVAHSAGDRIFGSERSLLDVLSGIERTRYRVVLALPTPSLRYVEAVRHLVDRVVRCKRRWWQAHDGPHRETVNYFRNLMQRENVDLLYGNTIMLNEAFVAAGELGVPTVCHVREMIDTDTDLQAAIGLPPSKIVDAVLDRSDYIVANSEVTARLFHKPERVFTVNNAVDTTALDMPQRPRTGRLRVGMLSSNIAKKGVNDLYALAKAADRLDLPVDFVAYGPETEDVQKIKAEIESRGGPDNIFFPGYSESAADAIRDLDVVVVLSRFAESFGRTAAEGMAARRPVIAYDHGALPSVIDDGVTGFLIPYAAPLAAINCLKVFLETPETLQRMGEAGRDRALRLYSLPVLSQSINHVFGSALAGEPATQPTADTAPAIQFQRIEVNHSAVVDPDWTPPAITVVVPNYNYEKYLPERLHSILNQTLKPVEIIFLDDCSPDNSLEVAEEILSAQADKPGGIPYRIIANETNAGVYRQWVKGLQEAKTDWVWIAEADDTCDEDFLLSLAMKIRDDVNVVYAQSRKIDEHSSLIASDYLPHTNDLSKTRWLEDFTEAGPQEILQSIGFRNTIPNTSAAIMRREAALSAADELQTFRYTGDWLLYAHMLRTGGLAFVSRPLNNFRRHSASVTMQKRQSLPYLVELARIREFVSRNFPILPRHVEKQDWFLNRDYKIQDVEKNSEHPEVRVLIEQANAHTEGRKRIGLITTNNGSHNGGSEMLWQEAAVALREKGHDVLVLIKKWEPEPAIVSELFRAGVKVLYKEENDFQEMLAAAPDMVVVSIGDQDEGIEYYPSLRAQKVPYVIVNQLTKEESAWPIREAKQKPVMEGYLGAERVFFTSRNNHRVMEDRLKTRIPNADMHFNPYHIDRSFVPPQPDREEGLQVAIPSKLLFIHKGQDLLLEALKDPKWRERDIHFNFYGAGPDREKLEEQIRDFGLTNLHLRGRVDDISEIWRDNHALLMPSRMEGLPIMVVSAMLSGRMCIATDVGGNAEVIRDGEAGFIIPRPEVDAVARTLEAAWERRDDWEAMGKTARADILDFLPEEPVEDFISRLEALWRGEPVSVAAQNLAYHEA